MSILSEFGMHKGELPFKYLGVPLSTKKLTVLQCQPLIKKVLERIESWTAKLLTYAGRLQIYWSHIFLIPKKVLQVIQSACRTFLWTGGTGVSKKALVAWDYLCLPQNAEQSSYMQIIVECCSKER